MAINESSIVAFTDTDGIIQYANDKFCEVSKYSREELIGNSFNIVSSKYHSSEFFKEVWRTINAGSVWKGEVKNKAKDGTYYWVDTTIVPFLNEDGTPYQHVTIRHDITKLKEYEETIKQMAYYDQLTMLPNRNWLNDWLNRHENKHPEKSITVLSLDIDRFKFINDNFGHQAGDMVLKGLAKRLQNMLESSDFIIRQGGDEFIIFVNSANSRKGILFVVDKVKEQFKLPFFFQNKQITVTTSIGISGHTPKTYEPYDLDVMETIIRKADTAMNQAKKYGGNTYCFNTHDQNNEMDRYYQLDQELKHALGQNEFSIVYQPLIKLKENEIAGVEALLRWYNPKLGQVPPNEFIPLLEELGYITQVGNWVLKSVCYQMKYWHDKGINIERAAVNVSPLQFSNTHFVDDVKQIINETGLHPNCLELEITEGTILDIEKSEKTLTALRDFGVTISIDDFGTGYSSLSYLKQLPVNTLKIDKSFIDDLDRDGEVIVNTIITMGKNLKFKVVAEGVEMKEQLFYLKNQNCHEAQGFYWSKPVEAGEIKRLCKEKLPSV